jgi:hypothetical protein
MNRDESSGKQLVLSNFKLNLEVRLMPWGDDEEEGDGEEEAEEDTEFEENW